ncbi:MAG: endonuclease III [Candidatus Marsarchaeota archaeon]|nr:endonuclease III [Candidatus Marsarchaeota archaeon]
MDQAAYVKAVLVRLEARYGKHPRTQLRHRNLTELFVAVLLSPQCNDKQVNKVTEGLFRRYHTFDDYAGADIKELRKDLGGLNYYKTKARYLKRSAGIVAGRFGGKVPKSIAELTELYGVGRKVANVILNEGYGIDEGIAVDTHCGRVSRRLGLSRHRDPAMVELDLMRKVPRDEWSRTSNLLIALGRDACTARNRECARCTLRKICPSSLAK